MTVKDEIRELAGDKGPTCQMGVALAALSPEDRAGVVDAMADPLVTGTGIARWLAKRGIRIRPFTVQRHRRGDCQCP